jgi:hypothetical protein
MYIIKNRGRTWKEEAWRLAQGPAMLIDGFVFTLTLGRVTTGLQLITTRKRAWHGINARVI